MFLEKHEIVQAEHSPFSPDEALYDSLFPNLKIQVLAKIWGHGGH